jgi:hypothetical protein
MLNSLKTYFLSLSGNAEAVHEPIAQPEWSNSHKKADEIAGP